MMTTSPRNYIVNPNRGIVKPDSTVHVKVVLVSEFTPDPARSGKDKFMVQSVIVSKADVDQDKLWKDSKTSDIMKSKLKCVHKDKEDGRIVADSACMDPPELLKAEGPEIIDIDDDDEEDDDDESLKTAPEVFSSFRRIDDEDGDDADDEDEKRTWTGVDDEDDDDNDDDDRVDDRDDEMVVCWRWMDDIQQWRLFEEDIAEELETHYQKDSHSIITLPMGDFGYNFDFNGMKQENLETGRKRVIRREEIGRNEYTTLLEIEYSLDFN
ncbi:uncharacterized protein LOC102802130 [Saccoglossus kowalevskii]|uniref:Vesicle-associated membrane protein-associated protein B-like n=1 Tax=Saccoglossus kowalevskii TaxID=10224 RepID=A0ABM0LZ15_SACKO|nr:PREDICTED: vesicle-associated membrane protein-associated protein B-like [Saccoglossus kowalevskii]